MHAVIHYSEIATKGGNRAFFENKLMENLKKALGKNAEKVSKRYGKILCELKEKTEKEKIIQILKFIPGIANFSFAEKAKLELDEIKKACINELEKKEFNSFKVNAKRSNKNFKLNSMELNQKLGEFILEKLHKKVDLHCPEITVFAEIGEQEALVYTEKIPGIGGLPSGASGKVISSLSGGIDSPVASYLMMKRGCTVVLVHIFNKTIEGKAVLSKIELLAKQLAKFQPESRLYIIKFEEIQKKLIAGIPSKYRMIAYRRAMMKLMDLIAEKEKAKAIVTGDNAGQVASQTLENIQCIFEASNYPVLSPLIGFNKEETIELAKKIGTYDYSIMPYPDCCSFMIAEHPETKSELRKIKELEEGIPELNELIEIAAKNAGKKIFSFS